VCSASQAPRARARNRADAAPHLVEGPDAHGDLDRVAIIGHNSAGLPSAGPAVLSCCQLPGRLVFVSPRTATVSPRIHHHDHIFFVSVEDKVRGVELGLLG